MFVQMVLYILFWLVIYFIFIVCSLLVLVVQVDLN